MKMLKMIPIKIRISLMIVGLLTVCCILLTLIFNFSANRMVKKIDMSLAMPALVVDDYNQQNDILNKETSTQTALKMTQAKTDFSNESIVFMILVIVLGGCATYYLTKRALAPLDNLNREIKEKNVHNLINDIEVPNTNDEIAELTQSFNYMMKKLNDSFIVQQRFSSNVAHELKTPLAILKTKMDVFEKKSNHSQNEYNLLLENIKKQIKRLSEIINNLLELNSMNDNIKKEKIQIKELLEEIILELSYLAKDKNINIYLECDNHIVYGSSELLYRAFYNIIENAIKYNVENGYVKIKVLENKNYTTVQIIDNGIGIPNELKKCIFEPFYCIDESRSKKNGGVGLGLTITKDIIKRHEGEIKVENNKEKGTCFKIILKNNI